MIVLYYQVFKAIRSRTQRSKLISIRNQAQNYTKYHKTPRQTCTVSKNENFLHKNYVPENMTYLTVFNPQTFDCPSSGIGSYADTSRITNLSFCTENHYANTVNDVMDQNEDKSDSPVASSNHSPSSSSRTVVDLPDLKEFNKSHPTLTIVNSECIVNSFESPLKSPDHCQELQGT
ncbi:unnamed protein product [Heterobilharzia americana]|nr:unnamed protein product [Heterobilharzia americana]